MGGFDNSLRAVLIGAALAALSSCGAGLITGIAASGGGGGTAEVRPPELSLTPVLPLVSADNTERTVVVTNAQIPASAPLRVTIHALGITLDQIAPTISGQGGSTAIRFTLNTAAIASATGDPAAADVDGRLTVLVADQPIAASVPIVLARQPRTVLDLAPGAQLFLSPFGEAATLRVTGLHSVDPTNLQMFVATRDPQQAPAPGFAPSLIRPCTNFAALATAVPGEAIVTATVPGNTFPDRAQLFVRDAVSGQSTNVDVYYRPEITLALPSQGLTTGGNLVTLIGTALAPRDFTQTGAPLSFGAVELSFEKGQRIVPLPREDFRAELSAGDRLVFQMPASPDGRPGQVDIVLRVTLGAVTAQAVASQVFLFANPSPFFGPRGAVLDQEPVSVVPIALDAAPSGGDAPDFAVLTEEGGAGFLQLLLAQENGMFLRFGARRRIGNPEAAAERDPSDLCTADFDGDQVPDLFVVNAGAAAAVHHIVLGQAKPLTPLGRVVPVAGDGGMTRCRVGLFNGDAFEDVLLVPGPAAPPTVLPQVLLSRPTINPVTQVVEPGFDPPIAVPVRPMAYQAVEIADLDGDGILDIAVVDGFQLKLDVAYGNGDGTFATAVALDFTVPTYAADSSSSAVGLHACGNGPQQSLGLVLSGDDDGQGPDPDPLVATFQQAAPRVFAAPVATFPLGPDPLGVSLVNNLDGASTPELELVVAIRGDPVGSLASVGLLRFTGNNFTGVSLGVEVGDEQPRKFRALHFGRAFPATQLSGEAKAVFAVHESQIDGVRERRLSTLLLFDDGTTLRLLPPDAGAVWGTPVRGIVGGNWSPIAVAAEGSVRDLALARANGADLLANDGFGGLPRPSGSLIAPGLVPHTLQLLPAPAGQIERLVFFDDVSRLGVWRPNTALGAQNPDAWSNELRLVSPNVALRTLALTDETRVQVADVDGDGVDDVVALLKFAVAAPGQGDALLLLMRGKVGSASTELPFFEPSVLTPVHGKATAFALGDFAAAQPGLPRRLELALAVPDPTTTGGLDGDHVRFFSYVAGTTPADDHFVASARPNGPQVLLAGSRPTRLAASDFDRDGLIDLLVAAAGDSTLRLFRNVALPGPTQGPVAIGSFQESLTSPRALAPGAPIDLRLGDVNGDNAVDAIVAVESTASGPRSTALAFYLSTEPGVFGDARFVSPSRVGNRNAGMVLDLGDWNRDGVLDLFLSWDTAAIADRNVRVLFGGSR